MRSAFDHSSRCVALSQQHQFGRIEVAVRYSRVQSHLSYWRPLRSWLPVPSRGRQGTGPAAQLTVIKAFNNRTAGCWGDSTDTPPYVEILFRIQKGAPWKAVIPNRSRLRGGPCGFVRVAYAMMTRAEPTMRVALLRGPCRGVGGNESLAGRLHRRCFSMHGDDPSVWRKRAARDRGSDAMPKAAVSAEKTGAPVLSAAVPEASAGPGTTLRAERGSFLPGAVS